jgi:hypothetical protein
MEKCEWLTKRSVSFFLGEKLYQNYSVYKINISLLIEKNYLNLYI